MKTIFMSDLLFLMNNAKMRQQAIGFFILGLIVSVAMGNYPIVAGFPALIMPLSSLQMIMYADGRKNWESFRLTLPLTRSTVITGRYATLAVVVTVALAIGAAFYVTGCVLTYLLPGLARFTLATPASFDGILFIAVLAACCLVLSLTLSVALPLFMKLGAPKVSLTLSAIPVLIVMLAFYAVVPHLRGWMALLTNPAQTVLFAGIAVVVALVIYAISAIVSIRLYLTRDF